MQDIIQINATWGIDLNALRGIYIIGKPLSKRELFTQHSLMIKDGKPYTGDKKGNIGGNTQTNFMKWLEQCTDFTETSSKILIENIKQVSTITHTTQNLLYKPYVETLFYNFLNNEYETSFINESPQHITMNIDYSMINDYFPQKFNVFGDMYNIFTASYYDTKLKEYLFNNYEIYHRLYYSYIMNCVRNSIMQNIDNTIKTTSATGMKKILVYTINGKALTAIQENFINKNYITPILKGTAYHINLTNEINKRLKQDFKDTSKKSTISNILQINEFSPICETWQIKIDRKYKLIPLKPNLSIDFCRQKLNENAIQKIKDISGYDTVLKYYNSKSKDFIMPKELLEYFEKFYVNDIYLGQYINDLETMMKDIC